MRKSVEVNIKPVKADAELMSAWLGDMEDISMSPKLLFDLQTLLRHYANFIVPNKEVSVDYMSEGTPCASVEKSQIFIPLDKLQEGRVDETIASVIHELHHIKFSYKETKICDKIYPFFKRILNTVEIELHGNKLSIWKALKSQGTFDSYEVIDRTLKHTYKDFIYQYFGDLFLLLNAIEDVRIDDLQSPNLKKYRFKQEKIAFANFEEAYANNQLDKNSLFGSFIDALFHLKGLGHSELIANSPITADKIQNVATPSDYFTPVFTTFGKVLQDHAGSLWKEFDEQNNINDNAISEFLTSEALEEGTGMAEPITGDDELDLSPIKASNCSKFKGELAESVRTIFGEDDIQDLLSAMNPSAEENGGSSQMVMNAELWAEIQAFKSLHHIPCREVTASLPQGVNYDTLILDCYA